MKVWPLFLIVALCGCSPSETTLYVPGNVNTATEGLPFAIKIKDRMAKEAHLTRVLVDLSQESGHLNVQGITYGFASTNGSGRVLGIVVNNITHRAYALLDAPEIPKDRNITASNWLPLDLGGINHEIADVLAIAQTNGLAEFCALAPGTKGKISLSLGIADTRIAWNVSGDGWDEKGPIAELSIVIDAKTGIVLNRKFQKGVGR